MTALVSGSPFAVDGLSQLEPSAGILAKLNWSSLRHLFEMHIRQIGGGGVLAKVLAVGLSSAAHASEHPDADHLHGLEDAAGEAISGRLISGPAAAELALDRVDIAGTLQGDQEAFSRLMARYQSLVAGTMWRFTHDRTIYEELVHNVFVEAYLNLSKFRGEGQFSFWLRKIAVRVGYYHWKMQARRRARGLVSLEEVGDLTAEEVPERPFSDDAERVFGLLERLPPRDRLVLTLMYVEGRSVAESAELAGWSQAMVKMQAFRARKKLEKLLRKSDS